MAEALRFVAIFKYNYDEMVRQKKMKYFKGMQMIVCRTFERWTLLD
jgi:hypothetical protein